MEKNVFENKKVNYKKLIDYGFKKDKNTYEYSCVIADNLFKFDISINRDEIKTKLTEIETNEIYTLHLTTAIGDFVGKIREEYTEKLNEIASFCFDNNIFKSPQTYEVIDYIKSKYNDDVEYLWEKFPDNAVARRKDNSKWYLAILTVSKDKFNFKSKEKVEALDLRADVDELPELIQQENIYQGYHMNKKHWISIILDNSIDSEEIYKMIDESYILAGKK